MKQLLLFSILCAVLYAPVRLGAEPFVLIYQGILTDSAGHPLADDEYQLTFQLYRDTVNDLPLWSERVEVKTQNGRFVHSLGSATTLDTLDFTAQYFLRVFFRDTPLGPPTALGASAYAFHARLADRVTSVDSAAIEPGGIKGVHVQPSAITATHLSSGAVTNKAIAEYYK